MNPVTRYVKEIERSLSGARRIQTSAKIYKALSIKVDALEEKLGRKPTDAEMEALLAEFGAPTEVAAQYSVMSAPVHVHELIKRYLAAVERRLPKEQAKDITAELREALTGKIEAKEATLGHAAGADDVAAILKDFGHPVVVASRYSGRDHLIGPQLYPWFWDAQRVGVGLVFAIGIIITAVRGLASDRAIETVIHGINGAIEAAIFMFGVIAVVFIVLERTKTDVKIAQGWNPKRLPQDHIRAPKPLFDTLFTLACDAIFILWWVKAVDFPNEVSGTSMELHFSKALDQVYTPILVLALATAAVHVTDIVHPAWSRLRSAVSILGHAGGLIVLWVLFRAGPLVSVVAASEEGQRALKVAEVVNAGMGIALGVTGLIWAVSLGVEIWRLIQATRPAPSLSQTGAA